MGNQSTDLPLSPTPVIIHQSIKHQKAALAAFFLMKKNLLIIAALLLASVALIVVLLRSAGPDRVIAHFNRTYNRFTLQALDTVAFPGRISIMKVNNGVVYGYVYKNTAIYSYDVSHRRLDTFFNNSKASISLMCGFDIDTPACYLFDASGARVIAYQPATGAIDSIKCSSKCYIRATRAATGNAFITQGFDPEKQRANLRLAGLSSAVKDSTLYEFTHFEDGGLSADGFFTKNTHTGDLYYIPFYNSEIIHYNQPAKQISKLITIDKTPPANIAVPSGKIYTLSGKAIFVNSAAAADDQYLYVLSYALSEDAQASGYHGPSLDIYNIATGNYESSIRLPGYENLPVLQLAKYNDTLVAAYDKNVLLFRLTTAANL